MTNSPRSGFSQVRGRKISSDTLDPASAWADDRPSGPGDSTLRGATPGVIPAKAVTGGGETWCTGGVPNRPENETLATLTPLRGISLDQVRRATPVPRVEEPALWFVTLTVGGPRVPAETVREGLENLSLEQPFLVSAAYASSRAEVRYWDESVDIEGAVSQALALWREHERSSGLPPWKCVSAATPLSAP